MAVSSSTNGTDTPFADITHFRSLIGALQYLSITRPDIQFAVNRVAQRMHQPSEHDYHCLKRILMYIFGTLGRGLLIRPGDLELRVSRSSAEAEYRTLALLAAETIVPECSSSDVVFHLNSLEKMEIQHFACEGGGVASCEGGMVSCSSSSP
uniref:Reverse transcriptase Ty1/copia-type domain-containing protein n=1 Tax=Solanum lycopersicum TaxID=4081 RepID=A0A3Q7I1W1_SOLLC